MRTTAWARHCRTSDSGRPKAVFDGLVVKLVFGEENITIPIQADRLDFAHARTNSKYYKKIIPLPETWWYKRTD